MKIDEADGRGDLPTIHAASTSEDDEQVENAADAQRLAPSGKLGNSTLADHASESIGDGRQYRHAREPHRRIPPDGGLEEEPEDVPPHGRGNIECTPLIIARTRPTQLVKTDVREEKRTAGLNR